jgi:hypothetical protein
VPSATEDLQVAPLGSNNGLSPPCSGEWSESFLVLQNAILERAGEGGVHGSAHVCKTARTASLPALCRVICHFEGHAYIELSLITGRACGRDGGTICYAPHARVAMKLDLVCLSQPPCVTVMNSGFFNRGMDTVSKAGCRLLDIGISSGSMTSTWLGHPRYTGYRVDIFVILSSKTSGVCNTSVIYFV